ncbi:hypothetical protein PMAYCL1PPCAC_00020, partial [Pristionchus mayeri]
DAPLPGKGNPKDPLSDPFTFKAANFVYEVIKPNGIPTTESERAKAGCLMVFCHFENKNGCRNECDRFTKLWKPENPPAYKGEKYTILKNEKECFQRCIPLLNNILNLAEGVCSSLCATH